MLISFARLDICMADESVNPGETIDDLVLDFGPSRLYPFKNDELIIIGRRPIAPLRADLHDITPSRAAITPLKAPGVYETVVLPRPEGETVYLLWPPNRKEWVALVMDHWGEAGDFFCSWRGPYALNADAKEKLREAYGLEEQCENIEREQPSNLESNARRQRVFSFYMGNEQLRIVNLKQILRVRGTGLDMAIDIPAPGRYDTTGWREPARIFHVDVNCRVHSSNAQTATINVRSHESGLRYAPAGDSAHDGYAGCNFDNYYDDWIFVKKDGDKLTAQEQIPVPHDI